MAKYFYVSSEKVEEPTKIYPIDTIQEFASIEDEGITFTKIQTVKDSFYLNSSILETIDKLESNDLIVWLETLPRFEANDFEFSIGQ